MADIIRQIRKRSGDIVAFDQAKVVSALYKAAKACDVDDLAMAERLAGEVVQTINKKFHANSIPAVEEIQDIIEEALISNLLIKIAKAYILYRDQHRQLREMNPELGEKLMEDYIGKADWRLKENSNMGFSVQGLNNYLASSISAK